jgi:circadian clock protein KaiB
MNSEAQAKGETVVFQLFVAGDEPHSKMAINNLKELCESHIKGECRVEILDVFKSFDIALANGIYLTPALLRVSPGPRITIFGNLSDRGKVLTALEITGEE